MMEYEPDCEDEEESPSPIQIDLYGFRIRSKPKSFGDELSPITPKGLLLDVGQSLLRVCRDTFGLAADLLTGCRCVVRGIAALPGAVAMRISRAHRRVEAREDDCTNEPALDTSERAKEEAVEELECVIDQLRAQGVSVTLSRLPDGKIVLSAVRPEHDDVARDAASDAIEAYLTVETNAESHEPEPPVVLVGQRISELKMSTRCRKCLAALKIETLTDITSVSVEQILSVKGVGEATLVEIRELLRPHGLTIGQNYTGPPIGQSYAGPLSKKDVDQPTILPQSDEQLEVMNRTISELNLSIRVRKFMARVGISSVGELVQRTPDELLASKNFGFASLTEVRAVLADLGLKLRGES